MRSPRYPVPFTILWLPVGLLVVAFGSPGAARGDVPDYVKKPDPSFSWEVKAEEKSFGLLPNVPASALLLKLRSQTWRGAVWQHDMLVVRPKKLESRAHAVLLVSSSAQPMGGLNLHFLQALSRSGTLLASLASVPGPVPPTPVGPGSSRRGQGFRGGARPAARDEASAQIAFTLRKFRETGDASWPLLLPMAKSVMRAMDCIQAVAIEKHKQKIEKFLIVGTAEGGWCAWLVGAWDSRVSGIAPLAFPSIHFRKQVALQLASRGLAWKRFGGAFPGRLDLPEIIGETVSNEICKLVDPYEHRKGLDLPKLILAHLDEPYTPVDAANLYLRDLPGDTFLHHFEKRASSRSRGSSGAEILFDAVATFYETVTGTEPRREFSWDIREEDGAAVVEVKAKDRPKAVELWHCFSGSLPDGRFFPSWQHAAVEGKEGRYEDGVMIPRREPRLLAVFGRVVYENRHDKDYAFCTPVRVFGPDPARKLLEAEGR